MGRLVPGTLVALSLALFAGCPSGSDGGGAGAQPEPAAPPQPAAKQAAAKLEPKSGSQLSGTVTLTQTGDIVTLELHVNGAPPGDHAVHVHEKGDCSAADGTSAGGHWNPTAEDHGRWGQPPHHLGDIGNMQVDDSGHGMITLATDLWSIGTGAANDVLGKAIIVHAGVDDFVTQPTGDAGGRIGCGVIGPGA